MTSRPERAGRDTGPPPAFDLLLFDLDGTLADPLEGIGRSLNHALSHFGYPPLSRDEVAPFVGPPLDSIFETVTGTTSPTHVAELVAKYRERYGDFGYAESTLYPGVADALTALRATGMALGLCTSKREDFADRILERFGLRDLFSFVSGGEVGLRKWQQIESLRESGRVSGSTLMIGDRALDLAAAHRNGLRSAGVLWGYGSRRELESERPSYLFERPSELHGLAGGTAVPRTVGGGPR